MTQATTKLHLKPNTFEEVNAILVDELEAMKEFDGLYDLAVVKVDELTLMINATYFSTALLDSCAAAANAARSPGRSTACASFPRSATRARPCLWRRNLNQHDTVMSDSLQAGLSKLGDYLAKPPERAPRVTTPLIRSPSLAPHTRPVRVAICAGTIGEVLMTKSTCPKPDQSQWTEPGEF